MPESDPELIALFNEETQERLSRVATLINQLREQIDVELSLEEIDRELHTVKGSVKMLNYTHLGTFVHEVENITPLILLDGQVETKTLDLLEECCDTIASTIDEVVQGGQDHYPQDLKRRIHALLNDPSSAARVSESAERAAPGSRSSGTGRLRRSDYQDEHKADSADFPKPPEEQGHDDKASVGAHPSGAVSGPAKIRRSGTSTGVFPRDPQNQPLVSSTHKNQDSSSEMAGLISKDALPPASERLKRADVMAGPTSGRFKRSRASMRRSTEEFVRVRASKLAQLDSLVSDLIDSRLRLDHHEQSLRAFIREHSERNQLVATASSIYQQFREDRHHLNLIVKGLEQLAIDLRLRPLGRVFEQVARTGRDLARKSGKKVQIRISGEQTELDRVILDGIRDPLGHIIRNVVDHGIELPVDRRMARKEEAGRIELSAFQEGISVVLQIRDDGAGIDTEKLKKRVVEKQLMTSAQVEQLAHNEVLDLVFIPGLSTRDQATETSGRGVGMDVVRRNVEALKGEVHISSELGKGTVIELRVPLSLLVSRVLLVRLSEGSNMFAFPTEALDSTESIEERDLYEYAGQYFHKVRDRYVPVIALAQLLNIDMPPNTSGVCRLAMIRHREEMLALEIGDFVGERSVVIKPLGWPLINVPALAGAILLGSGDIGLMLQVPELIKRSYDLLPKARTKRLHKGLEEQNRRIVLVVDDSRIYRRLARKALERLGYRIIEATNGEEGLQVLTEITPHLILTDFEMPKLNGMEFSREVKSSALTRDIPIVMVTTHGDDETRQRGLQAGVDEFIDKSRWDEERVRQVVQKFVPRY